MCNGLKYIFIVILITLICFAAYSLYNPVDKQIENNISSNYEESQIQMVTNLRLGICDFDTINPILSNNKLVQYYSKLIFEPLLTVEQDFSLTPCLATEYSRTGDKSYIIKLRQDVKWQDGQAFSANDVKYTVEMLKAGLNSIYTSNVANISGLEIIDDYTIKISLSEVTPFFEYNLIFPIMPAHYYTGVNFADDPLTPMGTGMFKIEDRNSGYIKLARNDNWWNSSKLPKIDTITINAYNNVGEMFNAFKIGNIDLVVTDNVNFGDYIGTIGFNHKFFKSRQFDFIAINTAHNVLAKKEVRQAINYGIDKSNIVASVFNNKYYISNGLLDYGSWLYNESVNNHEYNIEKAGQVLIENNWIITSRQWQKVENYKALRTSFNLVVNSSDSERVAVAENIKEKMANIGVIINIVKANNSQYNNYLQNKNYDLILTGTNVSMNPNLEIYFGSNNLSNYNNEDITKLLSDVKNITDKTLLKQKYNEIQQITNDDVVYIPLYINKNVILYSSNLVGDVSPNWYNIFYNIENWYKQN